MNQKKIEDFISIQLEDRTFEEILEDYDLSPAEVFWLLFQNGQIDEDILESQYESYEF